MKKILDSLEKMITKGVGYMKLDWDNCNKYGKGFIIVGVYCVADSFTQIFTGNHIHEYLGLNIPDPNHIVTFSSAGVSILSGGYVLFKKSASLLKDFFDI